MSEKEKQMLEKISKLPAALQEKFVDRLQGAVMALDVLDAAQNEEKQKPKE